MQATRDAAKTDEAAFRAALESVAAECCGLRAGAVTAAASTQGSDATRLGLVRLATEVLRARRAGGPLNGVFTPAARTKWRSYADLGDAKARARAKFADRAKGLGEAYDDLAAALAPFLPADVLPKPSAQAAKKAEGFTVIQACTWRRHTPPLRDRCGGDGRQVLALAPAPDATQPMDVDGAGAEAPRVESGDARRRRRRRLQGERPIASRDAAALRKARKGR